MNILQRRSRYIDEKHLMRSGSNVTHFAVEGQIMPNITKLIVFTFVVAALITCLCSPVFGQTPQEDRIYVLGAVNNPGDYDYKAGITTKDAIVLAGGLASNADPSGVVVVRVNGEKVTLNANTIMEGKDLTVLNAGDTLVVKPFPTETTNPAVPSIRVLGQVRKPGVYTIKTGDNAQTVVTLAGGLADAAVPSAAVLTREGKMILVDLTSKTAPTAIQAGDVLTVPEFAASVTGEVAQAGTYPLVPGKTDNLDALFQRAGGTTPKADLRNVRISSLRGTERPTRTVNATSQATRQATRLNAGDAVFVAEVHPAQKKRTSLGQVYQITIILATLASIFRN